MKTRDQLLKNGTNMKHDSDWIAVKVKRKKVKNSLKAAESDFVHNRIKECKCEFGEIWKVIRNFNRTACSTWDTFSEKILKW